MVSCVIGEVLWDIFHDEERFGGAALNFCATLQRLGDDATLLSAVGNDPRGQKALDQLRALGIGTQGISIAEDLPTGTAHVHMNEEGEPSFVIHRPSAFDEVSVKPELLVSLKDHGVGWIYFGTLLHTKEATEHLTSKLLQELLPARGFYDINLRTGHWNLRLVQRLSRLASIIKLNESEAATLFSSTHLQDSVFSLENFCDHWATTYDVDVICVTLGPAGCIIYDRGNLHRVPGYQVVVCDTVGSGDAFAAAFLHGYSRGWPIPQAARFANALGALVASRAGATPFWTVGDIEAFLSKLTPDDSD